MFLAVVVVGLVHFQYQCDNRVTTVCCRECVTVRTAYLQVLSAEGVEITVTFANTVINGCELRLIDNQL